MFKSKNSDSEFACSESCECESKSRFRYILNDTKNIIDLSEKLFLICEKNKSIIEEFYIHNKEKCKKIEKSYKDDMFQIVENEDINLNEYESCYSEKLKEFISNIESSIEHAMDVETIIKCYYLLKALDSTVFSKYYSEFYKTKYSFDAFEDLVDEINKNKHVRLFLKPPNGIVEYFSKLKKRTA